MTYLQPKRRLRDHEPLEPTGLNEDLIPVAERASGRFNEHNMNGASIKSGVDTADQAYYVHHYKSVKVNPHFGTPGAYANPDYADPAASMIPNSYEWEVVGTDLAVPDPMSFTFNSGNVILWIIGWAQYIWNGYNLDLPGDVHTDGGHTFSGSNSTVGIKPARVQFAIRIDGRIVEETIPGQKDMMSKAWTPLAALPQRTAATLLPGPGTPRNKRDNSSLGPKMLPDRCGAFVPVAQGEHTVELVCRRLSPTDTPSTVYIDEDRIYVYSRKLFVLEMHQEPQASTTFTPVTVDEFEPEDTFSSSEISTNRIAVLRTAENDVTPGMLARGALNHNHLPSPVLDAVQSTIIPAAPQVTDDTFPGFASSTIAGAQMGANGWWLLNDGAGDNLNTVADHPGVFNVSSDKCIAIVLANVQMRSVESQVTTGFDGFAAFSIGHKVVGTPMIIDEETTGFVDSGTVFPVGQPNEEEKDIPLFNVFEYTTGVVIPNIENYGVYASTMNPRNEDVHMTWERGSIQVILLRY